MVTSRVTLLAVLTLALIYVYVNRRTKALKLNKGNKQGEKEVVNTKNDKVYMVAAEVTECAPVKMDTVCVASANLATECAPVTARLRASVEKLLGREPRGLREVPVLDKHGEPAVVRVASLVGGKPFPTLFWLVDPDLCFRIDQAEASGLIKQFQKMVDADEGLRVSMKADHEAHIELRNQYMDAEERRDSLQGMNEIDGPVFKMSRDPRITPVGRFIRRWSIDELLQFFNVLMGDMSLVGPRPPIPAEVEKYERWQKRRLSMKPGITCLWQVNGRNNVDFDEWMRLDMKYIDDWSLGLDLKILAKTIPAVLFARGAR